MGDVIYETVLQLYIFLCQTMLQTPPRHNTIDRARNSENIFIISELFWLLISPFQWPVS